MSFLKEKCDCSVCFSMVFSALRTEFSRILNYSNVDTLVYYQLLKILSNFLLCNLCSSCLECSFSSCSRAWLLITDQVSVQLLALLRGYSGNSTVCALPFRTLVIMSQSI